MRGIWSTRLNDKFPVQDSADRLICTASTPLDRAAEAENAALQVDAIACAFAGERDLAYAVEFIPIKLSTAKRVRRTRKLCNAQQISIT